MPARTVLLAVAGLAVCLAATRCVTEYVPVLVETDPPGLELLLNGGRAGVTPVVVELGTRLPRHELVLRARRRALLRSVIELSEDGLSVIECAALEGEWTFAEAPGAGDYAHVLRFVRGAP